MIKNQEIKKSIQKKKGFAMTIYGVTQRGLIVRDLIVKIRKICLWVMMCVYINIDCESPVIRLLQCLPSSWHSISQ